MSDAQPLSDLQIDILKVLWRLNDASVAVVREEIFPAHPMSISSVATLLARLEKRRLVVHRKEGRQFVYRAAVQEGEVCRSVVGNVSERLFQGDLPGMVALLFEVAEPDVEDLSSVIAMAQRRLGELETRGRRATVEPD